MNNTCTVRISSSVFHHTTINLVPHSGSHPSMLHPNEWSIHLITFLIHPSILQSTAYNLSSNLSPYKALSQVFLFQNLQVSPSANCHLPLYLVNCFMNSSSSFSSSSSSNFIIYISCSNWAPTNANNCFPHWCDWCPRWLSRHSSWWHCTLLWGCWESNGCRGSSF